MVLKKNLTKAKGITRDSNQISNFVLPRLDWHDEEGRINKTALIQNFNAIEAKLNELSQLKQLSVIQPNWNEIQLPDTDLTSDDDAIISLKSFIDILDIKYMPIQLSFTEKKLALLTFYDNDYNLVTIKDKELTGIGTNNKNWIYLNTDNNSISVSANILSDSNYVLLGTYFNGIILHPKGLNICDINILVPLSKMSEWQSGYNEVPAKTWDPTKQTHNSRTVGYIVRHDNVTSFKAIYRDQGV